MLTRPKHWQDIANAAIGLWFIASPWIVEYQDQTAATWGAVAAGLVLLAVALGATLVPRAWEEWAEGLIGTWMVLSPWFLGFGDHPLAMPVAVWTGLFVIALELWIAFTDKDYIAWWRKLTQH